MHTHYREDDPRTIWQEQPAEAYKMSSILMKQKARDLRLKGRQQMLASLLVPVVVMCCYLLSIRQFPHLRLWLHYSFTAALTWSLTGLYFVNRGTWPGTTPDEAGFSSGLQYCRRELERQRKYLSRGLPWSFGPIVLAVGTFILTLAMAAGDEFLQKARPLLVVAALWVVSYSVIWRRKRAALGRESEDLAALAGESSQ